MSNNEKMDDKTVAMVTIHNSEDESTHSNSNSNEDGNESASKTVAAVPKKRGRPAKGNKLERVPTGRGRGRPRKDGRSPVIATTTNAVGSPGRGRPAKTGKPKVNHPIESTGRGRGRPKKAQTAVKLTNGGKSGANTGKKGRPRKVAHSEDERDDDSSNDTDRDVDEDDDEEERRPVGRPATGAVNLNIERTGRGQGRPRKQDLSASIALKRRSGDDDDDVANGGAVVPKKRGRPSLGSKAVNVAHASAGKPRGRPKKAQSAVEQDDDDSDAKNDEIDNFSGNNEGALLGA